MLEKEQLGASCCNMWVFMRTSMNFAHLANFPQSPRFPLGAPSTMTTITAWEEMKVWVQRIHWEIRLKNDE